MRFGRFPLADCKGAVLAHSLRQDDLVIRKGAKLTADLLGTIAEKGIETLTVAIPEPGDVDEDSAARRIAAAFKLTGIEAADAGTGRVNLHASCSGVFTASRPLVDAINAIDPDITLATLDDHEPVRDGRMVATVKIIPYFVAGAALEAVERIAAGGEVIAVHAYAAKRVGVISTSLPSLKDSVIAKTGRVLQSRLDASGSEIAFHERTAHDAGEVEAAIRRHSGDCDMLIIFGASAISDALDVIPAGLRAAGGDIVHLGMPVDPGNLLMLGALDGKPVLGAPGCARSAARNGFDFVLERLLAGIAVTARDVAGMGVGGLLMEIASRPQPRETAAADGGSAPHLAAIILAAGQSRRMGGRNKLLLTHDGKPLVAHVADAALAAGAVEDVIVVTGHQRGEVEAALAGRPVRLVHNPAYEEGLSSSLRAGIEALAGTVTHAMILLGDMPQITSAMLETMAGGLAEAPSAQIRIATANGKRGNPVLWPRAYFEQLAAISGDTGARHVIGQHRDHVMEIELGGAAALDVDTPEAYQALEAQG
ncbi:MAG: molybdopterin-binding/glycosyltransferase family 2 protein [Nitratireductor sp.]|nr:molybdopterin-binding/glycosyltransferase family 2 protein [Nitratireductor sp.]